MTRDETIALFERCEKARLTASADGKSKVEGQEAARAIWNSWAAAKLAERDKLAEAREWQVVPERRRSDGQVGANDKTKEWLNAARIDFCDYTFDTAVDFSDFIFPGDTFFGPPREFRSTRGKSAIFHEFTIFDRAEFHGIAWFDRVIFATDVGFDLVTFHKKARFVLTQFEYFVGFRGVKFYSVADFRSVHCKGVFDMWGAQFASPPDFIQAHFDEAPVLDSVVVPLPTFFNARHRNPEYDLWESAGVRYRTAGARYRALRRLAAQGHDYDNERRFLKGEIRARRYCNDKPSSAAFWFGIGYDLLSDFGDSIMRPAYWGLASIFAFAGLYYAVVFANCSTLMPADAIGEAIYLSLKNALVLISWDKSTEVSVGSNCVAVAMKTNIWTALSLALVQIAQKIWSAGLLFLFLLAIRNRFKIK